MLPIFMEFNALRPGHKYSFVTIQAIYFLFSYTQKLQEFMLPAWLL